MPQGEIQSFGEQNPQPLSVFLAYISIPHLPTSVEFDRLMGSNPATLTQGLWFNPWALMPYTYRRLETSSQQPSWLSNHLLAFSVRALQLSFLPLCVLSGAIRNQVIYNISGQCCGHSDQGQGHWLSEHLTLHSCICTSSYASTMRIWEATSPMLCITPARFPPGRRNHTHFKYVSNPTPESHCEVSFLVCSGTS